jgi:hypothetical protein
MEKHFKYFGVALILALFAFIAEPFSQSFAGIFALVGLSLSYLGWMAFLDRNHKQK